MYSDLYGNDPNPSADHPVTINKFSLSKESQQDFSRAESEMEESCRANWFGDGALYQYTSAKNQIQVDRDLELKKLDKLFNVVVNNAATTFEHGIVSFKGLKMLYRQNKMQIKAEKAKLSKDCRQKLDQLEKDRKNAQEKYELWESAFHQLQVRISCTSMLAFLCNLIPRN